MSGPLVARCRALLAAGEVEQAKAAALPLEATDPATEAEWQDLTGLFTALGSAAWAQIMTERFLVHAPDNLAARLAHALDLSAYPARHDAARAALDSLAQRGVSRAEDWLTLSTVAARCGRPGLALDWVKAALAIEPANVAVKVMAAHRLINLRATAPARAEIAAILRLTGDLAGAVTAMRLAMRLEDQAFVAKTLQATLRHVRPEDHAGRGRLIPIAAWLGAPEPFATLAMTVEFAKLGDVAELEAIHRAMAGRGFFAQERRLVTHALCLAPEHVGFQEAHARQMRQASDFLPAMTGGAKAVPRRTLWARLRQAWPC